MYRFAVRRPVSTLVAATTLVVLGAFALARLPVALLPSLERPQLVVDVEAEGRSREEILHGLTEPLERVLLVVPGVQSVVSETEDGRARLILEAEWNVDADRLRIDVGRRVEGTGEIVPDATSVAVIAGDAAPVVEVAVRSGGSDMERFRFARDVLRPELARLPGAGRIDLVGAVPARVIVRPRAAALAAAGLTAADLSDRLQAIGRPVAAGRAREGAVERPLVVREAVRSLEELRDLLVPTGSGAAPLGTLAGIAVESDTDGTLVRIDGERAVLVALWRAPGANAVALAAGARERIASLAARAPGGLQVAVIEDASGEIVEALRQLALASLLGIVLGTFVLRAMLGRLAPTLALALVIPASLLVAFLAFHAWGVPLDVVSLAGLALAAGMLVDNSIVVVEAIETARARGDSDPRVSGTAQVAAPIVAACATTAVVFVPLLYLRGLARVFFGEQAFAIVAALAASLILALTLSPVLAGRGMAGRQRSPGLASYRRLLSLALRRPLLIVSLAMLFAALGLAVLTGLPRELFPAGCVRELVVAHRLPEDLSDESLDAHLRALEAVVTEAAGDRVARRLVVQGLPERAGVTGAVERSRGRIRLQLERATSPVAAHRMLEALNDTLARLPDVEARARVRTSAFVEAIAAGGEALEVRISAPDEAALGLLAARVSATLLAAGVPVLESARERARAAVVIEWDEARLASLGQARAPLELEVRASLGEHRLGRLDLDGIEPELLMSPVVPANLDTVPVRVGVGGEARVVPLAAVARTMLEARPARVRREDGRPARRLVLGQGDRSGPIDALDVLGLLGSVPRASGERVELAGEALELARSFQELHLALALSVVLSFLTLAALQESLLIPIFVMTSVPIGAAGGLIALAVSGQSLNVMSFLGLLVLGGLVVNNGIVLVHRIGQRLAAGRDPEDAVREAASERFRPILLTTVTTLLGMLPLALLGGDGVELRRALATTVVGGLITSTAASLLLVPVLACWAARRRGRRR